MKTITSMRYMLAVLAVSMFAALPATDAEAKRKTVKVDDEDVEVSWSRPGSNTDNFTKLVASILFPVAYRYDCVDASSQHTGWATAVDQIAGLLIGQNFCPDASDLQKLAKPCYGQYQFSHPKDEKKVGGPGKKILFIGTRRTRGKGRKTYRIREAGYVYYGWGDCWNRKYVSSSVRSITCHNATFGDPKPGVNKMCFYQRDGRLVDFEVKHFRHT